MVPPRISTIVSTMSTHRVGRRYEALAASWLEARDWRILARNWRDGPREIDLVVARGDVVAFVEVKARRDRAYGHPLEAITRRKRREVQTAARAWLRQNPQPGRVLRFDAVAIVDEPGRRPVLEHVPDAWRVEY